MLSDLAAGFGEPRQLGAFLDAVRWGAIASADKTVLQAPVPVRQARTDVLGKLLALNHYRHQRELASGVLTRKKPRPRPRPAAQDAPTLDDGALSAPPDALF